MTTTTSDLFVETKDFERYVFEAKKNPRFHNLGSFYFFDEETEKTRVFHLNDWSCAGVLYGKQLANAWNNGPRGQGRKMALYLVAMGGTWLNCDDGRLVPFYQRAGFREVLRAPFSPDFFPEDWDAENLGKPDCVFMAFGYPLPPNEGYCRTWEKAEYVMENLA